VAWWAWWAWWVLSDFSTHGANIARTREETHHAGTLDTGIRGMVEWVSVVVRPRFHRENTNADQQVKGVLRTLHNIK
jgi:hypothetical protein